MIRTVTKVIAEGVLWAAIGLCLLWLTLPSRFLEQMPPSQHGLLDNNFARRWDGTCTGWTREMAVFHVSSDLLLWNAYVVIALVMWRLHPIIKRAPNHRITLHLICFVFLTCGAAHLFSAYVVFNPVYVFDGAFKVLAGVIGALAAVYVARDLVVVFDKIQEEGKRLDLLEGKLAGVDALTPAAAVRRNQRGRVAFAVLGGLAVSLLGGLLWFVDRGPVYGGLFQNQFAGQWTGECRGWTKSLAFLYVSGSLITWVGYVLIGWVVLRLHPISRRVRMARVMVPVVSLVLASCGSIHLVEAYSIFNPIYVALGWLKLLVAIVSLVGALLVSQTLVSVFDATLRDRRRLMELEVQFSEKG